MVDSTITKNYKIIFLTAVSLVCYVVLQFFLQENSRLTSFFNFIFTVSIVVILFKNFELIFSVSKLNSELDKLKNRQNEIENMMEKNLLHCNRLDNKLSHISSLNPVVDKDKKELEQTAAIVEVRSREDQLELNMKEQTDALPGVAIDTNFLSWDILLKALNFPSDKNDSSGFKALNIARRSNTVLRLLQVSEDFLNLLAQDGIYLDDLKIEPPHVQAWLNFVKIDKQQYDHRLDCLGIDKYLVTLKKRTKSDTVFRDTSLMLIRRFDKLLRDKLEAADNHHLFQIAETRTGKAFLIVGKISKIF